MFAADHEPAGERALAHQGAPQRSIASRLSGRVARFCGAPETRLWRCTVILTASLAPSSNGLFAVLHAKAALSAILAPLAIVSLKTYPEKDRIFVPICSVQFTIFCLQGEPGTRLGVQMLPVVLALACISCLLFLVYRKCFYGQGMRVSVCFGPFLSLAALATMLMWPWL